jgi:hypothetical protein
MTTSTGSIIAINDNGLFWRITTLLEDFLRTKKVIGESSQLLIFSMRTAPLDIRRAIPTPVSDVNNGKTASCGAQSIEVASPATNWFGHEGSILRFMFLHSIALACLAGILVMLQAYIFTGTIVHRPAGSFMKHSPALQRAGLFIGFCRRLS